MTSVTKLVRSLSVPLLLGEDGDRWCLLCLFSQGLGCALGQQYNLTQELSKLCLGVDLVHCAKLWAQQTDLVFQP